MSDTPKATMSEAKCEVCGRPKWNGGHALNERECDETDGEVCRLHQAVTRANERAEGLAKELEAERAARMAEIESSEAALGMANRMHTAATARVVELEKQLATRQTQIDEHKTFIQRLLEAAGLCDPQDEEECVDAVAHLFVQEEEQSDRADKAEARVEVLEKQLADYRLHEVPALNLRLATAEKQLAEQEGYVEQLADDCHAIAQDYTHAKARGDEAVRRKKNVRDLLSASVRRGTAASAELAAVMRGKDAMGEKLARSLGVRAAPLSQLVDAASAELARLRALPDGLREALKKARAQLDRDRTGLAAALNRVVDSAKGRCWIPAGEWGSYSYEEHTVDTMRKECGWLIEEVLKSTDDGLRASGTLANVACREIDDILLRHAAAAPLPSEERATHADDSDMAKLSNTFGRLIDARSLIGKLKLALDLIDVALGEKTADTGARVVRAWSVVQEALKLFNKGNTPPWAAHGLPSAQQIPAPADALAPDPAPTVPSYVLRLDDAYELVNLLWLILSTQNSHCNGDWHCQIRWKLETAAGFSLTDETPYPTTLQQELDRVVARVGTHPNEPCVRPSAPQATHEAEGRSATAAQPEGAPLATHRCRICQALGSPRSPSCAHPLFDLIPLPGAGAPLAAPEKP